MSQVLVVTGKVPPVVGTVPVETPEVVQTYSVAVHAEMVGMEE